MPRWLIGFFIAATGPLAPAYALSGLWGTPHPRVFEGSLIGFSVLLLNIGVWIVVAHAAYLLLVEKDLRLRRLLAFSAGLVSPHNLYSRILPILLIGVFMGAFSSLKILIPFLNPFTFDSLFSDMDRAIFGTDPWRLTHALVGPAGTGMIDYVYVLWFPTFLIVTLLVCLLCDLQLRRRYLIAFLAVWGMLGIVAATLLSSAGPCFLELIGHPYQDRYADLLPVRNADYATLTQSYLEAGYRDNTYGVGKGISAMPSIHVSVATLYVLVARHAHRAFLALALAFYAVILFGSVHLGYHYFVDGVAGTLGTMAIWWLAGRKPLAEPLPAAAMAE